MSFVLGAAAVLSAIVFVAVGVFSLVSILVGELWEDA